MTGRVVLTAPAQADIQQAQSYFEARQEGLGAKFVRAALEVVDKIADHPLAYARVMDDIRAANVGRFKYRMFFVVEPDQSVIVACIHMRRDPKLLRSRFPKPGAGE